MLIAKPSSFSKVHFKSEPRVINHLLYVCVGLFHTIPSLSYLKKFPRDFLAKKNINPYIFNMSSRVEVSSHLIFKYSFDCPL